MAARKITMAQAAFIGLGNIIGAGIFVLAGTTIHLAGPGALVAFVVTAVLATTVALNSAELSSKIVTHGGLYSFVKTSMGDALGFLVGWLRAISYAIAAAAVALGFAAYLLSLVGIRASAGVVLTIGAITVGVLTIGPVTLVIPFLILLSITLLIAVALVDYMGLKLVAVIEQYLVFLTAGGLALFIVVSLFYGSWTTSRFTPVVPLGAGSIVAAAALAFFAYSGFNTIATLTPEVEDGPRNVPRAILIALAVSTVLYLLVVAGMLALMPWQAYGITADPLSNALMYAHAPGFVTAIIAIVAIIATVTVTLSLTIAGSRTLLQMSEDGMLPRWIGGLGGDSPRRSVLLMALAAVGSLFLGNLAYIALASNFGVIFSYALTGLAVVILRRRRVAGVFASPWYPWVQVLSILLSIVVMAALGDQALYFGALFLLTGIVAYALLVEARRDHALNAPAPPAREP